MKLKYITLNVWLGGKLLDNIFSFLENEKPDILAIQEAYNETDSRLSPEYHTLRMLSEKLGFAYTSFAPAHLRNTNGIKANSGNAVLSRFPLIYENSIFFDRPYGEVLVEGEQVTGFEEYPRNMQHVTVRISETLLDIFNVHGIWGENGEDNQRRLAMSQTILEAVKDKSHVILSGDFNVNQETKSIRTISAYLHDIFDDELKSSFNMNHKPKDSGFATAVVDHIFTSRDLKVTDHYMPDVDVSDHMPLVAVLEIS